MKEMRQEDLVGKIPEKAWEEIVSPLDETYPEQAEIVEAWVNCSAVEPDWKRTAIACEEKEEG